MHQAVGKNAGKPIGKDSDQVEARISTMEFVTRVPRRNEIQAAREEPCLESTQEKAKGDHRIPLMDKAVANLQANQVSTLG